MNAGDRLGPYEIVEQLGAGGMGEVWRARDPRLERDVAIKLLPADLAGDLDRLARFEREAKLLAQLNHAHIAGIYGLEEADGIRFIAMECVEGATLADKIEAEGRIDVDEALEIARQIAEGLEAADQAGIVHRDLKPANVKVTEGGTVKILDFGLAKGFGADGSASEISADLSHSPTMAAATRTGVIMGTAAYMSPEQARGKKVDKRADIWAFGCVLYEMLTGRRAFEGETVSDVMAAILTARPRWDALPLEPGEDVIHLLRRCLEKDPSRRLRDIGEARLLLSGEARPVTAGIGAGPSPTVYELKALSPVTKVSLLLLLGLAAVTGYWARGTAGARIASDGSPEYLTLAPPEGSRFDYAGLPSLAISPDGRWIAYVASTEGGTKLWVADLEAPERARPVPGSLGATNPAFSPDGREIAFASGGRLRVARLGSQQQPLDLAPALYPSGLSWSDRGILFIETFGGPLRLITEDRTVSDLLAPPEGAMYSGPQMLPDGERVLLSVFDNRSPSVAVVSIATGETTLIAEDAKFGRYAPTGHIVYARGNELFAVEYTPGGTVDGPGVRVVTDVINHPMEYFAEFAVADDGSLVYLEAAPAGRWIQRLRPGAEPETLNAEPLSPSANYWKPRVSPSGDRLLLSRNDFDLWSFDLTRGELDARLTHDGAIEFGYIWGADGQSVVFGSTRAGIHEIWQVPLDRGKDPVRFFVAEGNVWPQGWTPDGRLAFSQTHPSRGNMDVLLLTPGSTDAPTPLLNSTDNEDYAAFSPDGRLLAYVSDNTGRHEVYLTTYPGIDRQKKISTGGGMWPEFAGDGSSVFYIQGGAVMRARIVDGPELSLTEPEMFVQGVDGLAWTAHPDGQSVIALEPREAPRLRLVRNAAILFEAR